MWVYTSQFPLLLLPPANPLHLHITINLENPYLIASSVSKGHYSFQLNFCTDRLYYICIRLRYKMKSSLGHGRK